MAAPRQAPPRVPPLRCRLLTRGLKQVLAAREAWAVLTGCARETFFSTAPTNVLELILLNLDELDRLRAGMACVSLRRASASPLLWRNVTVRADSWTQAHIVAVMRAAMPHVRELRVEGCGDPHTCGAFACVVARLNREPTGPASNLRVLEAPAPAPEDHPPMRRSNARAVIDTTAQLRRLCESQPELRVHIGGAAPMYCLGSVDWYREVGANLRLTALSDLVVTPDHLREPNSPCLVADSLPLVESAQARTVFLKARRWTHGMPLDVVSALMAAGVTDLRLCISPTSGLPALPPRSSQAFDLERLDLKFDRVRGIDDAAWRAWMALPSLRHLRIEGEDDGVNVMCALTALRDTASARLDILDVRGSFGLGNCAPLLDIVASENAPQEVRISDYMSFVEDRPAALRFLRALGPRVRRVVALVLDAGFALDDSYYLRAGARPEMRAHGAVAAELARKNIDFRFQGK